MMLASSNALKSSAMYIGYLILKEIKKQEAGKISAIFLACVPFPAPGAPSMIIFITSTSDRYANSSFAPKYFPAYRTVFCFILKYTLSPLRFAFFKAKQGELLNIVI